MKKLLNTLYVTSENSYLALDGENIVIYEEQEERGRLPLHNLEGIVSFGYRGTSPALMGACADRNISLCYVTPQGRFLARVTGKVRGNVLLRKQQYESSQDKNFTKKENGAVLMDDEIRKKFLTEWQKKKKETITHPYLNEKIEWGMIPYVQSMLLARYLRGDLDSYPVFLWK